MNKDPLASFDFDQVAKPGLFLKFEAGKPVVLRVLTTDPVLQEKVYEDKLTGETQVNMKFNFIVYNLTAGQAQIWSASAAMGRKIGELHKDIDFGADIRKMDLRILPTGEKMERRYDMQVLRHSGNERELTQEQIKEARSINLDDVIEGGSRMSIWKPETKKISKDVMGKSGLEMNINPDDVNTDFNVENEIDINDIPF